MMRVVAGGLLLVLAVEVVALVIPHRGAPWLAGVAVALVLGGLRLALVRDDAAGVAAPGAGDLAVGLQRWQARTETLIEWSESTRADWDRHLRPLLARQFEMATRQRAARDPATFHATGRMLLGAELWRWVDPDNVARGAHDEPAPGRAVLSEILRRLEQV